MPSQSAVGGETRTSTGTSTMTISARVRLASLWRYLHSRPDRSYTPPQARYFVTVQIGNCQPGQVATPTADWGPCAMQLRVVPTDLRRSVGYIGSEFQQLFLKPHRRVSFWVSALLDQPRLARCVNARNGIEPDKVTAPVRPTADTASSAQKREHNSMLIGEPKYLFALASCHHVK